MVAHRHTLPPLSAFHPLLATAADTGDFAAPEHKEFDVLGWGQAMVDFSAHASSEYLEELGVQSGERRLIDLGRRTSLLSQLSEGGYAVHAAGSLSNTLLALARLSDASARLHGRPPLRVGMAPLLGSDSLGAFYAASLRGAGLGLVGDPSPGSSTGTVIVLTGEDAQRTMLSYLGHIPALEVSDGFARAIRRSRLLVIEGYLWEMPGAAAAIDQAMGIAREAGTLIALTSGDAGVISRNREPVRACLARHGADLLFANAAEAWALASEDGAACAPSQDLPARAAALALAPLAGLVSVTDGSAGSCIAALGAAITVPPPWSRRPPVDTCGAGDAYAAGLLLGFLDHGGLAGMGEAAARAAAAVIARDGPGLDPSDAESAARAIQAARARRAAQQLPVWVAEAEGAM
ncbi:putative sugar kinase [Auxenochlorella protothecoides]|uniref:Putative sugar kinase n=1 Tax=Auxenochlorella protothecoides TaxID=3075 RepID=A0A087SC22_AUXPR|nr:putative sugar kinase [Auxenochlorella protothecoides]KFM23276.1 putative sugar kinase [Auxenochlorella protothecoides]